MIPSRPLDFGGIINESIRIIRETWWRSALVNAVCSLPGILVMLVGFNLLFSGFDDLISRYLGAADQHLTEYRDLVLIKAGKPERLSIYRIQYPEVLAAVDSVHAAVAAKYPDSVSRQALQDRVDSISHAISHPAAKFDVDVFLSSIMPGLVWLLIGLVIALVGGAAATAATYDLACRAFEQRAFSLARIFNNTFRRWMWMLLLQYLLIGLAMLTGLGVVVGITAAISPVLGVLGVLASFGLIAYALIRLVFAPVALVSEDLGPVAAVTRSFALTNGHWWRVFGITVLSLIMIMIVISIIRVPFTYAAHFDERVLIDVVNAVPGSLQHAFSSLRSWMTSYMFVLIIPSALAASFFPSFLTSFYYDMRTRLDGPLDYYEDSDELSAPPSVPPTTIETQGTDENDKTESGEPPYPPHDPPPPPETNQPE